jgi:hypothetical protein
VLAGQATDSRDRQVRVRTGVFDPNLKRCHASPLFVEP